MSERESTQRAHEPAASPEAHPEAGGFGSARRRLGAELVLVIVMILALPLGVVLGARAIAERVAVRMPAEMDERLGWPTWQALQASGERCASPAGEAYVRSLLTPLLEALGPTPFDFQLMLSRSTDVNAFALPGGYIVVNVGLLEAARSGEEVAAVLAHELSHVTLRHSTKRLAGSLGSGAALALVLGFVDLGAPAYTLAHLAGLSYERNQESEADAAGLELLERAGISPLGMASFFERLSSQASPPEILSTHPDPGGRAERARGKAEGAQPARSLPEPPDVGCGETPK